MKEIKLTRGFIAIVDDDDFDSLNQWKWCITTDKEEKFTYAVRRCPVSNMQIRMHRQIMHAKTGEIVDHRNHDTLDNRKSNLRICTVRQNGMNRVSRKGTTSVYLGVHKHISKSRVYVKSEGVYRDYLYEKWGARITVNGKYLTLGVFKNEVDAALAYNRAAIKYHGEFANTNTI